MDPLRVTLLPAVSSRTHVFATVTPPEPDTLMPDPAATLVIPVLLTVTLPAEVDTLMPLSPSTVTAPVSLFRDVTPDADGAAAEMV